MSDHFKITGFLKRLKSNLVQDSYSAYGSWLFGLRKKGPKKDNNKKEESAKPFDNPENEKLFKLGETLGLTKDETEDALELVVKATAKFSKKLDVSAVILSNDIIKYPFDHDFSFDIPENSLNEIERKYPDLHLAICNPFEFFYKFPKTVSVEMFKKFSYTDILDFSRRCPEEYRTLSTLSEPEEENEST